MIRIKFIHDTETKKVSSLKFFSTKDDDATLDFLTKLCSVMLRGGVIVMDQGLATEVIYEAPGVDVVEAQ
jgi:hypothetical protein